MTEPDEEEKRYCEGQCTGGEDICGVGEGEARGDEAEEKEKINNQRTADDV